jgi:dephospho-CoA kinase
VGEIEYLKNIDKNFLMLATDAPIELRYQRLVGRNRSGDEITFEEFKRQEDEELKPTEEFAPNLAAPIKLAHFVIINDSDLKSFENKIESILSKYGV